MTTHVLPADLVSVTVYPDGATIVVRIGGDAVKIRVPVDLARELTLYPPAFSVGLSWSPDGLVDEEEPHADSD